MKRIAMVGVLLLAGCATSAQQGPTVVEGNQSTVVVDWARSTQGSNGALAVADAHCAHYDKHARYAGKPNAFRLAYDCIK